MIMSIMDRRGRSQLFFLLFSFSPPTLLLVLFLNHAIAHVGPYNGHDSNSGYFGVNDKMLTQHILGPVTGVGQGRRADFVTT